MPIDYSFMTGQAQTGTPTQVSTIQQLQAAQAPQQVGPLANISGSDVTTQNSGGIADALMAGAPDPVSTGNANAGGFMAKVGGAPGLSYMLASLGSALSARDPNSWQHQLSGTVAKGAQNQLQQRGMLISALQQKMGAKKALNVPKGKYSISSGNKLSLLPSGGGA